MTTTANLDPADLLIRTQETPNPFALKFVANQAFKHEGKATFHTAIEAERLPLVHDLFSIEGVKQVYVFQNTLTVTHDGMMTDEDFAAQVTAVIRSRYAVHDPNFAGPDAASGFRKVERPQHADPLLEQIEEVLDRTIRPGLQADGGDVEIVKLENNELYIFYQGACGGCPSAMMGTLDAIQGILRHELALPELIVIPID